MYWEPVFSCFICVFFFIKLQNKILKGVEENINFALNSNKSLKLQIIF